MSLHCKIIVPYALSLIYFDFGEQFDVISFLSGLIN